MRMCTYVCVCVYMLRPTTHIWFITIIVLYHFVTFPYLTFVHYFAIIVTKCKIERVTFCYICIHKKYQPYPHGLDWPGLISKNEKQKIKNKPTNFVTSDNGHVVRPLLYNHHKRLPA